MIKIPLDSLDFDNQQNLKQILGQWLYQKLSKYSSKKHSITIRGKFVILQKLPDTYDLYLKEKTHKLQLIFSVNSNGTFKSYGILNEWFKREDFITIICRLTNIFNQIEKITEEEENNEN